MIGGSVVLVASLSYVLAWLSPVANGALEGFGHFFFFVYFIIAIWGSVEVFGNWAYLFASYTIFFTDTYDVQGDLSGQRLYFVDFEWVVQPFYLHAMPILPYLQNKADIRLTKSKSTKCSPRTDKSHGIWHERLPFGSYRNIDGFCSNIAHFKALQFRVSLESLEPVKPILTCKNQGESLVGLESESCKP